MSSEMDNVQDFMDEYVRIIDALFMIERTLTPAEIDKREEIAKAIERENPGIDMSKKMAIATAAAKKLHSKGKLEEIDYSAKKAAAGEDIGRPGKKFKEISAKAAERYGSKEAGERVAGAILKKLRQKNEEGRILKGPFRKIKNIKEQENIEIFAGDIVTNADGEYGIVEWAAADGNLVIRHADGRLVEYDISDLQNRNYRY